jgi:thioredoxin reductase (NADPH)
VTLNSKTYFGGENGMSLTFDVGLGKGVDQDRVYDLIIIGSGPAGLSAALYASRAHLDTLVLTGQALGGQVSLTSDVDNYPGFPAGLTGAELAQKMQEHAERFGAVVQIDTVTALDLSQRPFRLTGQYDEYRARALVIAVGASPRKLNMPGEREFTGRGVSYCATCDGWFFRDKEVVVVGGGDSALEEAVFLTKYARKVTVVHRRDQLRAGPALQKRAFANDKIEFVWNAVVSEIIGGDTVEAVRLKNTKTDEQRQYATDGVFIFIGHLPNTDLFKGQLQTDDRGYLVTDARMATGVEGVWAAGEVADPVFRQVITSAGMGAAAAIQAQRWLDEQEEEAPQQAAVVLG